MIPDENLILRCAYQCAAEVIRHRRLTGAPIPKWIRLHYRSLHRQLHLNLVLSRLGPDFDPGMTESNPSPQLITASEAAAILGVSRRHITRIAHTLDGVFVGGRWLFNRAAVIEYTHNQEQHD